MAAALTITTVKAAFYAVLTSDSAIVAALGAGASGAILRGAFRAPHPVAPFAVLGFGTMTGARQDVRTLFPTLWLYDDDLYAHVRLNALAALIEAAYTSDCIAYCDTRYAGGIGDEITDAAVQRPALSLRYQVRGRF